jgi:general stress protein 26
LSVSDEDKIIDIMRQTFLHAYLATCDGDQPMVRPVSPIIEDCSNIWVSTEATSRKVEQVRKNPRISLAFVDLPRGEKAATVIGRVQVVTDPAEKQRVWELAGFDLSVHFPDGPGSDLFHVMRILVDRIEWRDRYEGGLKIYVPPAE